MVVAILILAMAHVLPVNTGNFVFMEKCAFSKLLLGYNVPLIKLLGSWLCLFLFFCHQHVFFVHNCTIARDFYRYVPSLNTHFFYKARDQIYFNVCKAQPTPGSFFGIKGNNVNYSKFKAYFLLSYGSMHVLALFRGVFVIFEFH